MPSPSYLCSYDVNSIEKLHENNVISATSHRFEAKTGKSQKTIPYNATASVCRRLLRAKRPKFLFLALQIAENN